MKLQTDKKALLILGRRNTMECVQKSFYGKTKSSDIKHSKNIVALSPFSLGPSIDASKHKTDSYDARVRALELYNEIVSICFFISLVQLTTEDNEPTQ